MSHYYCWNIKLSIKAGRIKQLFGQLLVQYQIYLARDNIYWAQAMLFPILVSPLTNKSDIGK